MGFGSYDESEQGNQEYDTDFEDDEDGLKTEEEAHAGEVNFEFSASNDELLDKLEDIKEE
ncbi:hypothetical protein C448_03018 [Halococcus morrhuae DSM 1307]|jgi:hypothetical protein|uniref:DUF5786 domain-containing protein n=2 Tax=Halococcus TaxID=2249 RepID=M0MT52_HALMO|nr:MULTISPECIES: DUF5786 family protein [Halococcus]EMA48806.1 hypothetical protein C448_03018 [Halococcus morrhuae DSM 1307]UOO95446.1 DUF5786 family protein [Halococcus dombrowskii]